jgi:PAS domain S-box-containing protein
MSSTKLLTTEQNILNNISVKEKLSSLLDNAPFCIHEVTTEGKLINVSKSGLKMLNIKSSEVKNRDYFSFIDSKDQARIKKLFNKAITGKVVEFTYKLNIPNKEIYCLSSLIPLKKMSNNLWHLIGTTYDVTEKKLTELKYDRKKQQFYEFIDNLPIGITHINKEYKFTVINKFFRDKILDINDAMGKALHDVKDQSMEKKLVDIIGKKPFADIKVFLDKAFKGESSTIYNYQPKFNSYFLTKIFPLYNKNNHIISIQTASIDITEKKLVELQNSQKEKFVRNIPIAVSVYNKQTQIIDINNHYLEMINFKLNKNYKKEEIIMQTPINFLGKEGAKITAPYFSQAFAGNVQNFTHYQPKFNSYFFTNFLPNYNDKKEVISVTATCSDITAFKTTQQQLENSINKLNKTNIELENYSYTLAHDLREPIRAISISNELLARSLTNDKEKTNLINQISHNTEFIDNLICNLLDYNNIDKIDLKESSNLRLILDEIIANYKTIINKKIDIIKNIKIDIINMNKLHLRQLLQNIISNAIKHNNQNEIKLEINTLIKDNIQIIKVKDNGIGINKQHSNKINYNNIQYTSGLGLIICKKIIELYHGKIIAKPHSYGSVFSIHIPI